MPVIGFGFEDFKALYGKEVDQEALVLRLPMLGGDLDKVDGNEIHMEYFPDRPDLVSVEGIARAMRAFDGLESGVKTYRTAKPEGEVKVDPSVGSVRPLILACHVKGLPPMDDAAIKDVMDFQERLGFGIGRRRKRVAIGIHDAARITPPYTYTTIPGDHTFHPLQSEKAMSAAEVVTEHPKGKAYGRLLPEGGPYPAILDADGHLLSMPPVINGERTALKEGTTDLVVDLTGPDLDTLETVMAILVSAFMERGAHVVPMKVVYPDDAAFGKAKGRTITTPDLTPRMHALSVKETDRVLGFGLDKKELVRCLNKMGHDATPCGKDDDELHVYSPRWRGDILAEVDLIEDVAKGYGYNNVEELQSQVVTYGATHPVERRARRVRDVFVGQGFLEVQSLTISNERDQYDRFDRARPPGDLAPVTVTNPITEDHTVLREWLTPSLFHVLKANRHRDYPQALFEVGQVVSPAHGHANRWKAAAVRAEAKAGFTRAKSLAEAMLRDLGLEAALEEDDHPAFIPGRVARFVRDGEVLGFFGEVHPRVLERYEVGVPVTVVEFDLDALMPLHEEKARA